MRLPAGPHPCRGLQVHFDGRKNVPHRYAKEGSARRDGKGVEEEKAARKVVMGRDTGKGREKEKFIPWWQRKERKRGQGGEKGGKSMGKKGGRPMGKGRR